MVHDIVNVKGPNELHTLEQNFMLYKFFPRLKDCNPLPQNYIKDLEQGLISSKHSVNVNTFSTVITFLIVTRCLTLFFDI